MPIANICDECILFTLLKSMIKAVASIIVHVFLNYSQSIHYLK